METIQPQPEIQVQPSAEEEQINWKRFFLDLLETLILAVVLYLGINAISARVRVDGFSMRPTLQDGEYVLVYKLAYKTGPATRGDIIVFRYPRDPKQDLIKRVIGLPGDQISIQNGTVKVNGVTMDEPYIAEKPNYTGAWRIPEGQLFVLGDNRNDSSDSHAWGLLPLNNVIGKAVLIYWPPPEWQIVNHAKQAVAIP